MSCSFQFNEASSSLLGQRATSHDAIREKVGKKISSDGLRNMVTSVAAIFRDVAIDEVIKLVKDLKIERKIYLLRSLAVSASKKLTVNNTGCGHCDKGRCQLRHLCAEPGRRRPQHDDLKQLPGL